MGGTERCSHGAPLGTCAACAPAEHVVVGASERESMLSPEIVSRIAALREDIAEALREKRYPDKALIRMAKEIARLYATAGLDTMDDERAEAFSKGMKKTMIGKYGGCIGCGRGESGKSRHAAPLEAHHLIPRSAGGDSQKRNALLVCRTCHVDIHQA